LRGAILSAAIDLLALAQAAVKFSQATADVTHHRELLDVAYHAWRKSTGNLTTRIARDDANWNAMLQATADEFRLLQNARGRERRAKAKLLALADGVQP
jgi:hypothetical protein